MKKIADNIIIFIICAASVVMSCGFEKSVIVILSALAIGSILIYADNKKIWLYILCGYIVLCIAVPEFIIFLPMILYHSIWHKFYYSFFSAVIIFPYLNLFQPWVWIWVIIMIMMSALLAYYSSNLTKLEKKMIVLRDTSMERDMLLREKNKELMEKQDYEIYLATLKERNRIAREIHDNVGHLLTRSILQVGALKTIHSGEPVNSQLESVNETLNQAMTSIRKSVHDLHDDAIDLKQAVSDAIKEMNENYDLTFEYDMSKEVPKDVKYCLIATVKEAMSNITKHSNADKIDIILREHPGFYQMSIEDNGTIKHTNEPGIGLINMRERVENLGGTIHFHNEKGFQIFISIRK